MHSFPRHRLVLGALCGVTLIADAGGAQSADTPAEALGYASTWFHGLNSIPDNLRERVAADRSITDLMEQTLLGRHTAPPGFNKSVALWWLAESGNERYLPTFVRFSREPGDVALDIALYGLARHAAHPQARARLLELDASATSEVRGWMVGYLALVRDADAVEVLRAIRRDKLPRAARQQLERALASPARAKGSRRVPCLIRERAADPRACDA